MQYSYWEYKSCCGLFTANIVDGILKSLNMKEFGISNCLKIYPLLQVGACLDVWLVQVRPKA